MALLKALSIGAAIMFVACEPAPTDVDVPDQAVTVHAMLIGGDDSVTVVVARPSAESDFVFEGPQAVTDAVVRLRSGTQQIVLANRGRCLVLSSALTGQPAQFDGCYTAQIPGGVRNGERYELEVEVPGEPLITGVTVVPPAFTLLTPAAGDTIDVRVGAQDGFKPFTISWTGIEATHTVRLQIVTDRVNCAVYLSRPAELDFGFEILFSAPATDAPTVFSSFLNCGDDPSTVNARLVATAFDTEYERYLRDSGESMRIDEASIGLNGAFGFFGSAAQASQPIELVRN